jgi:hypothetical protein
MLMELLALEVWSKEEHDKLMEAFALMLSAVLPPGSMLGDALFNWVASITPIVAVELVIFKMIGDQLYVLMAKRPKGDPWEDLYASKGTIFRSRDQNYLNAIQRLVEGELGGHPVTLVNNVAVNLEPVMTRRGLEVPVMFVGTFCAEPEKSVGEWILASDALKVPDGVIVPHHRRLINEAMVEMTRPH